MEMAGAIPMEYAEEEMAGAIPMEYAEEIRTEMLENARTLDLAVIRGGSPVDSDPDFAGSFKAIETFVAIWTAYRRVTERKCFSSEHEAWCEEVILCMRNATEFSGHPLLRNASTTETYICDMVQSLEEEGQPGDTGAED